MKILKLTAAVILVTLLPSIAQCFSLPDIQPIVTPKKPNYYPKGRNTNPLWTLGTYTQLHNLRFAVQNPLPASLVESYSGGIQTAFGAGITRHFLGGTLSLGSGVFQLQRNYVNSLEGSFLPDQEYGLVNANYKPNYMSVPIGIGIHTSNNNARAFLKATQWINILQSLTSASSTYGAASSTDLSSFVTPESGFKAVMQIMALSAGIDFNLDPRGRVSLNVEPSFLFSFSGDKAALSDVPTRQYAYGIRAGLQINYLNLDKIQHKEKRRQRLLERQQRLEQNFDQILKLKS